MPKNITLAIDEDLLDKVRVLAALRRTSVNAMVREYLEREVIQEMTQASRAEVWNNLFRQTEKVAAGKCSTLKTDGAVFDRDDFYNEVMRERGLF